MGHGETPNVVIGQEDAYKRIFYSDPAMALQKDMTISPGFGVLWAGTPLAKNASAAGNVGKYVPYNPTVPSSSDVNQVGRAFLVQDASGTTLYVTMEDSYKFIVGDDVIILDANTSTTSSENLGAITAIDRTTYVHMAGITVTTAPTGSTFTVAQSACIQAEAGADNTNSYSDAVGVLGSSVDTGVGENAKGAVAPMIISNVMLYNGLCPNVDAAARTDMSASVDGLYLIIK